MAHWELRYHNSFIDVEEVSGTPRSTDGVRGSKLRARSHPPMRTPQEWFECPEEEEHRIYVNDLSRKVEALTSLEAPDRCTGAVVEPLPGSGASVGRGRAAGGAGGEEEDQVSICGEDQVSRGPKVLNLGSGGHPELCRRPCLHFARGSCANGMECNFCHLEHNDREAKLDKKQRGIMQNLSIRECSALIFHLVEQKVSATSAEKSGQELIELVRTEAAGADLSFIPQRDVRKLKKTLARQSLHSLISVLGKAASSHGASSTERIFSTTERFRDMLLSKAP